MKTLTDWIKPAGQARTLEPMQLGFEPADELLQEEQTQKSMTEPGPWLKVDSLVVDIGTPGAPMLRRLRAQDCEVLESLVMKAISAGEPVANSCSIVPKDSGRAKPI